jgi:hypothetical protein
VDVVERKVGNQVQFWSLLGPFFVLLSIAVLLFKVSPHWVFPVSALIGIPLCVKWKMKGMAAALCCLFLMAGISYQNLELDDRYWHVGLFLSMAFSFIVLTLSLEEAQGLVGQLQLESQSRLDNFLVLDEKWKAAEWEWCQEKERAKKEAASLMQESVRMQEEKQTFYKLSQLAKEELVQVKGQHERLLQDLQYKKQQIAQLHERLEETETTIQGFVNSDTEKHMQTLIDRLTLLERDHEVCKAKLSAAQEQEQSCQIEKDHLWIELQGCEDRLQQSAEQNGVLERLKMQLEQSLQQMQAELKQGTKQKENAIPRQDELPYAPGNTRQIETMYIQLKEQFEEKCQVLDAARRELFHAQEQLQKCRREYAEEHHFDQPANEKALLRHLMQLGKQFEKMQKLYQQEIDELTQLVGHLLVQIPST